VLLSAYPSVSPCTRSLDGVSIIPPQYKADSFIIAIDLENVAPSRRARDGCVAQDLNTQSWQRPDTLDVRHRYGSRRLGP
jgi:hypothetical protein